MPIEPKLKLADFEPSLMNLKGAILRQLQGEPSSELNTLSQVFIATCLCDYRACMRLLNDEPTLTGQAEVISRSTVEIIHTYLFIALSPKERFNLFQKNAWRNDLNKHNRYLQQYGDDPEFKETIAISECLIKKGIAKYQISDTEQHDLKLIKWPTMKQIRNNEGKICSRNPLPQDISELFMYLEAWMYDEYSTNVHCGFHGLISRYASNITEVRQVVVPTPPELWYERIESYARFRAAILLLMMLSEVIGQFSSKLEFRAFKKDALFIWGIFQDFMEADELKDLRYRNLLS